MRYLSIGLLFMLLFTSCSNLNSSRSAPQMATAAPVSGALSTIRPIPPTPWPALTPFPGTSNDTQAVPTAVPTLVPTAVQSPSPTQASLSGFSSLRFAVAPEAAPQQTFPAGTEEVFAIWDYRDMQDGDRIRRIWLRDNLIWLTREENWNWNQYGGTGTVQDISVYDNEGSGLEPAVYRLQLYINDTLQQEATFTVLPPNT